MKTNDSWIFKHIKENPLETTLQIIGIGVLLLNIWLTTKLAPLAEDIGIINTKVEALTIEIQTQSTGRGADHDDIQIIKTKLEDIGKSVDSINLNVSYLLTK